MMVAFVLLIGGAAVLYDRLSGSIVTEQIAVQPTAAASAEETATEESAAQTAETALAPDFVVYDRDGKEVRLSEFFGKPIVLNFWASWCGPCQSEMPDFNEKYESIGEDVHFVMVNMTDGSRETVEKASAFIDQNNYSFPVFFDTTSEAALAYGAYSLPTSFFINAEGRVVAQVVGAINSATLQRGIDMILM